ncbi:hypothetical protein SG26_20215 (plasmid) [Haloarcula sp. CBA1115]|nr:hypothetical protein SG26_20215 [Haloarcula sp. CBA1115]
MAVLFAAHSLWSSFVCYQRVQHTAVNIGQNLLVHGMCVVLTCVQAVALIIFFFIGRSLVNVFSGTLSPNRSIVCEFVNNITPFLRRDIALWILNEEITRTFRILSIKFCERFVKINQHRDSIFVPVSNNMVCEFFQFRVSRKVNCFICHILLFDWYYKILTDW